MAELVEVVVTAGSLHTSSRRCVRCTGGTARCTTTRRPGSGCTRATLVPAIVERARAEHPDEVPCVIALPLTGGHPDYLAWVATETRAP
ncbi:MAG: CutA1 divalent ion tolerance protein [Modestobacter sp.]|nr:CutA1 divalent ion tolerance protein [Modestobacter sp.]